MKDTAPASCPWLPALMWLAVLGPAFFLLYGAANQHAAGLPAAAVPTLAWDWERHIPFVPWTIVPYWSIDVMYGVSLFLCRSRRELHIHAARLLLALLLSCAIFWLFPLRFSGGRPEVDGVFGLLFDRLRAFDAPFNQAPSLHISLLLIIWSQFRRALPRRWHALLHAWCGLIGVSVLTTWQHHVIDVPTGAALGGLVCLLLPQLDRAGGPWQAGDRHRARQLGTRYAAAGAVLLLVAALLGGWAWLLAWPAGAALWVASGYWGRGPRVWQKHDGRHARASTWMLAPVRWALQVGQWRWRRQLGGAGEIHPGLWLGSVRDAREAQFVRVLDLTCEYTLPARPGCVSWPLLDLLLPSRDELEQGARHIDDALPHGPLLVCCALGLGRSAALCVYWLATRGHAADVAAAWACLQQVRPRVVLSPQAMQELSDHVSEGAR